MGWGERFVEHGDAIGETGAARVVEVVLAEVFAHRVVARESVDGMSEVGVGVAVASEQSCDPGQDVVEVESVGSEEWGQGEAEVEDEEVTVWAEHAVHFAECVGPGAHVPEAESNGDGVEGVVGEGELEGVCDDGVFEPFLACLFEHGFTEICAGDGCVWEGGLDGESEVTGSCGEVEDVGWVS